MLKYNFTLFNSYVLTVSTKPCLFLNSLFDSEKQYKICILSMIKKKKNTKTIHIYLRNSITENEFIVLPFFMVQYRIRHI